MIPSGSFMRVTVAGDGSDVKGRQGLAMTWRLLHPKA
jgi:hypothetical protein